jgi:formylglycine-generating enzyme required for sulfatase activity
MVLAALITFSLILALVGRFVLRDQPSFDLALKATAKKSGDLYGLDINGILIPELVEIPAGSFLMGSSPDKGSPAEWPEHKVTLDRFWISPFEITNAQFEQFCKATGRPFLNDPLWKKEYPGDYPDHPVVGVSWQESGEYCKWLGSVIGKEVRLPTEAEWEYAAQGSEPGTTYELSSQELVPTTRVGTHSPNVFGLYDMLGNVTEWCQDWYDPHYYQQSPERNPVGPEQGQNRVLRGCSWATGAAGCRVAARSHAATESNNTNTSSTIGFRVVARD